MVPTHLTFWDICRTFDSVPKWLQRLAWARLGLDPSDLEWFLKLDKTGRIIIRTPDQQTRMSRRTDIATGAMLEPLRYAFHPDKGIEQGDTPSTLIFIAVFDILLSLVDNSHAGEAHAYTDDLVHIAPSLEQQHRLADLVCGFFTYTGLEISLAKVEAISINYGNILYDTPYLMLHTVQHQDDGY